MPQRKPSLDWKGHNGETHTLGSGATAAVCPAERAGAGRAMLGQNPLGFCSGPSTRRLGGELGRARLEGAEAFLAALPRRRSLPLTRASGPRAPRAAARASLQQPLLLGARGPVRGSQPGGARPGLRSLPGGVLCCSGTTRSVPSTCTIGPRLTILRPVWVLLSKFFQVQTRSLCRLLFASITVHDGD